MRRLALAACLAIAALAAIPAAFAQVPPERPPGGFASGGYNGAGKSATAASGAATLHSLGGRITTEALVTAAGANYTLVLTNSRIAAADQVLASVAYVSATTGTPVVARIQTGSGTVTIVVRNADSSAAFNGTLAVSFIVFKN
jgi:hypothetical protein